MADPPKKPLAIEDWIPAAQDSLNQVPWGPVAVEDARPPTREQATLTGLRLTPDILQHLRDYQAELERAGVTLGPQQLGGSRSALWIHNEARRQAIADQIRRMERTAGFRVVEYPNIPKHQAYLVQNQGNFPDDSYENRLQQYGNLSQQVPVGMPAIDWADAPRPTVVRRTFDCVLRGHQDDVALAARIARRMRDADITATDEAMVVRVVAAETSEIATEDWVVERFRGLGCEPVQKLHGSGDIPDVIVFRVGEEKEA